MQDPSAATVTPPTGRSGFVSGADPSWLALEPDPVSAKTARVFTRTVLLGGPRAFVDDVEMVVGELVTNAIVHAPGDYDVPPGVSPLIHLSLQPQRRWVLVGVRDPWPDMPRGREPGELGESGRGLAIVYALAAACWTDFGRLDKTVHAVVARPGQTLTAAELERLWHS